MGQTLAEKILAAKCGKTEVRPGEFISAQVDLVLASELSGVLAIEEFEKINGARLFDPQKIVLVMDHFTPAKDIKSAEIVKQCRDFARKHNVKFYDVGRAGIQHVLLPSRTCRAWRPDRRGGPHTCTLWFHRRVRHRCRLDRRGGGDGAWRNLAKGASEYAICLLRCTA
jgi:3-isopropylmalate/(R)-2-methylmalate dehydratase large subunit